MELESGSLWNLLFYMYSRRIVAGLSLRVTCIELGSCIMLNSGWLQSWVVLQYGVVYCEMSWGETGLCLGCGVEDMCCVRQV